MLLNELLIDKKCRTCTERRQLLQPQHLSWKVSIGLSSEAAFNVAIMRREGGCRPIRRLLQGLYRPKNGLFCSENFRTILAVFVRYLQKSRRDLAYALILNFKNFSIEFFFCKRMYFYNNFIEFSRKIGDNKLIIDIL